MKLQSFTTPNEVDDQDDHRDYQKDVNESSKRVGTNQSQQPENQ